MRCIARGVVYLVALIGCLLAPGVVSAFGVVASATTTTQEIQYRLFMGSSVQRYSAYASSRAAAAAEMDAIVFASSLCTAPTSCNVYSDTAAQRNYCRYAPGYPCADYTVDVWAVYESRTVPVNNVVCPAGSRKGSDGVCICNLGGKPGVGGVCGGYTCGAAGTYTSATSPDVKVTTADTQQCVGGCVRVARSVTASPDGQLWAQWPFTSTGASAYCGGLAAENAVPLPKDVTGKTTGIEAPLPCEPGTYAGTVNGTSVCVKSLGPVTTSIDSTTGQSGVSTRDVTTCVSGQCTTVKVDEKGVDIGGAVIGKSGTQLPGSPGGTGSGAPVEQEKFCAENPNSIICKTSSFSGTCDAVACDGDAVQCAMAREQAKRMCELIDKVTPLATIGIDATVAGDVPTGHPGALANVTSIGVPALSDTPIFGSSNACPSDVTLALRFGTVTIPFSSMCTSLGLLGMALKGIAYLTAAMIIFRRGM